MKNIDYSVIIQTQDLDKGELRKASAIRADKLYTLSKQIVKRKFGHVQSTIINDVILKINEIL